MNYNNNCIQSIVSEEIIDQPEDVNSNKTTSDESSTATTFPGPSSSGSKDNEEPQIQIGTRKRKQANIAGYIRQKMTMDVQKKN